MQDEFEKYNVFIAYIIKPLANSDEIFCFFLKVIAKNGLNIC